MGFLSRLFRRRDRVTRQSVAAPTTRRLSGDGAYALEIVGESYYQEALEAICGGRTDAGADVYTTAVLILDDDNPHDPSAVRVEINGMIVGYLSRDRAREYRHGIAAAGHPRLRATCGAHIQGGWDRGERGRGNFGVSLDLPIMG